MYERIITDEEFLNSFQSYGFAARPAISHLLCEKLRDDPTLKENDIKAILLQTLENYYFQTEIILMVLESFHQKKLHPEQSLVSIYNKVFIREGKDGKYSINLLEILIKMSDDDLINYLGLKSPKDLIKNLDKSKKEELEKEFASSEKAVEQGYSEIKNLRMSLKTIVSNRLEMKNGTKLPFYKLLNKLKHGYQVVEDEREKVLSIMIDLVEDKSDKALFKVIEIPIQKDSAYFYTTQTKNMANTMQHLLQLYMLSNE